MRVTATAAAPAPSRANERQVALQNVEDVSGGPVCIRWAGQLVMRAYPVNRRVRMGAILWCRG